MATTSPGRWGQIIGSMSFNGICSHASVPKEVFIVLCTDTGTACRENRSLWIATLYSQANI